MNVEPQSRYGGHRVRIDNHLPDIGTQAVIDNILTGLSCGQKYIESMFFYDSTGSQLFEEITRLPEYYLTRTEMRLIEECARHIGSQLAYTSIIELGSGDCSKISILFSTIPETVRRTIRYVPVDVCPAAIEKSIGILARTFPSIAINGIIADFFSQLNLLPDDGSRLFCFFGSTIGNFSRAQAARFFTHMGSAMQPGDRLLIGMDMVKEKAVLENAYNDSLGITAAFNKNILNVVNTLVGTEFDPHAFAHVAFYNVSRERIEMHLKAKSDMAIVSPHLAEPILIRRDETIHTENSHKFTHAHIDAFQKASGLDIEDLFTDPEGWFSLVHFVKRGSGRDI